MTGEPEANRRHLRGIAGFARGVARSAAGKAPDVWAEAKRQWSGASADQLHPHVGRLLGADEQLLSLHRFRPHPDAPEPPMKLLPWAFDERKGNPQSRDSAFAVAAVASYAASGAMDWVPDPSFRFRKEQVFYGAWESLGGQLLVAFHARGKTKRETVLVITDRSLLVVRVMHAYTKRELGPSEVGWGVRRADVKQIRQTDEKTVDLRFVDDSWLRVWVEDGDLQAISASFPFGSDQRWPGE
ncbi:hypothetical protein [Streptomyces sp. 8N706]|uniref:hypothetical protein n=1 Tax=Streptomyces sp. 8N706 TaxID=3457416 RepID=UPI003FD47372